MKTSHARFLEVIETFHSFSIVIDRLQNAKVDFIVGGSVSLYVQGSDRRPHDVDIMFLAEEHNKANNVFGLVSEYIERPNVTMFKSSPTNDESVDFLSEYKVISDEKIYHSPPTQKVFTHYNNMTIALVPAEKIAVIKLIGLRDHHSDSTDAETILKHVDFDNKLFWDMVEALDAHDIIRQRLEFFGLKVLDK